MEIKNLLLLGESLFSSREAQIHYNIKSTGSQQGFHVTTLLERRQSKVSQSPYFLKLMARLLEENPPESIAFMREDMEQNFGSSEYQELYLNFPHQEIFDLNSQSIKKDVPKLIQSQLPEEFLSLSRKLCGTFSLKKLETSMNDALGKLGISCCSIFIFQGTRFGGNWNSLLPPEEAKRVYSLESANFPDQWMSLSSQEIPLLRWVPQNCHRYLLPLSYEEDIMGFLMIEDKDDIPYTYYETLRGLLSQFFRGRELQEELKALSLYDEMTQIYNIRGFQTLGDQMIRQARRMEVPLSLFYCDIHQLEEINQNQGREAGDRVLKETSALLQSLFRKNDVVGRIGGDEFAILALGVSTEHEGAILKRMDLALKSFQEEKDLIAFRLQTSVSRINPGDPYSLQDLLSMAEFLMEKEG